MSRDGAPVTTCAQFVNHLCTKCDEVTVHDAVGCIHCRTPYHAPVSFLAPEVHALRFGGQVAARARMRIAANSGRNRIRAGRSKVLAP